MNETFSLFRDGLNVVNLFGLIAVGVVTWMRKPGEDAAKAVDVLRAEVNGRSQLIDEKIITLTERIQHMPTSEELAQLEGTVKQVGAQVHAVANDMMRQNAQLARIEQYLLSSKA